MKSICVVLSLVALPSALFEEEDAASLDALGQWGQWRGPLGNGVSLCGNPPVDWSEARNVRWKLPLPGVGHSTPIVWGERSYVTAAIPGGEAVTPTASDAPGVHDYVWPTQRNKFVLLAVSRREGEILWEKTLREELPHEGMHSTGSLASNSPITDDEHLFVFFGSRGLYCLDMDGELQWEKDLGDMATLHAHGEGSSPALSGDTLIVNWDHEGQSYVVSLDKSTGEERWKVLRDEVSSWLTPLVVEKGGASEVIISATNRVRAYGLETGEVIWECGGLSSNVVAMPVSEGGMLYTASSYDFQSMLAIRLAGASGDITDTDAIVWRHDRYTPYVPSPLLYGGLLFFPVHLQGYLMCVEAESGKVLFGPERLPGIGNLFASPVGASDRVYVTGRSGVTYVIKRSAAFEVLGTNRLDDSFSASPAIVGDALYIRGERYLYCIAKGVGGEGLP